MLAVWLVWRLVEERALAVGVLILGTLLGVCGAQALTDDVLVTGKAMLIGTMSLAVAIPLLSLLFRWSAERNATVAREGPAPRPRPDGTAPPPRGSVAPAPRKSVAPAPRGSVAPPPRGSVAPPPRSSVVPPTSPSPTGAASRSPRFSVAPSSRAVCKHGLHYDPATRSGCAKCERENRAAPTPAIVWGVLAASVLSAAGAGGLFWRRSRAAPPRALATVLRAPFVSSGGANVDPVPSVDIRPPPAAARVTLPPPTEGHPWKGTRDAPVVVQVFGDLVCPYTRRVVPTLERLIVDFPQKVRIVWRSDVAANRRLSRPALRVALATFAEKGPGAFWNFQQSIDDELSSPDGLRPEEIFQHAAEQKVELAHARKAFDGDDALDEIIEGDTELARINGLGETPVTVINGIVVRGVQPAHDFQNAVRKALEELQAVGGR